MAAALPNRNISQLQTYSASILSDVFIHRSQHNQFLQDETAGDTGYKPYRQPFQ
jgi:hypothetical protein